MFSSFRYGKEKEKEKLRIKKYLKKSEN